MKILAQTKYLRISPRKLRLVASTIKNLSPLEAIEKLKFLKKKGSQMLISVLRQGIGNAKNNFKVDPENLIIGEILVEEGPRLKRIDKSHGARFDRGIRQKRLSHLKIYLVEKETGKEKQTLKKDKEEIVPKKEVEKEEKNIKVLAKKSLPEKSKKRILKKKTKKETKK